MPQQLVWRCIKGRSAKFYALSVEPDLWGNRTIVRRWGRLDGTRSRAVFHFNLDRSFEDIAQEIHQRRIWHQYELIEDPNRTIHNGGAE